MEKNPKLRVTMPNTVDKDSDIIVNAMKWSSNVYKTNYINN